MRKPVAAVQTKKDWTIVICNDGTAWLLTTPSMAGDKGEWHELAPPLPGTAADPIPPDGPYIGRA